MTEISQCPLQEPVMRAIRERRSIRSYTDAHVSDETIRALLDAGRWAPSGMNNQPFRFLVLRRADPRFAALSELTKYTRIVRSAPVMITVFLDRSATYHQNKDHQSAGACVQNIMLAAHAHGLGTVWLGQMMNNAPQVLEALGLSPEAYEFITALPLGVPAEPGTPSRKPLADYMLEAF